jgi:dTDP-4-amino-4,6-dideoxygalactose transaminase
MKKRIDDLAIFGGPPAFGEKLHVGRPNVGDRKAFLRRVEEVLDRRWLTNNGYFVRELESRIATLLGVKHCIAMCNGTVGLEIAIRAAGLTGEVIVPSFTFIATAHALQWQELTPVFCDIDPKTHNIDPQRVEEMITPRTSGIIGVHIWGRPCEVDALSDIARRRNLKLLFDAAHAFHCSYGDRMIGNFGDAEVFSFHATKFFNTLEGGAVTTNDDQLAARMRLMKNFGFKGQDNVIHIGTNGKMDEISAAMGLTCLEGLDEMIRLNRQRHQQYAERLASIPGMHPVLYPSEGSQNYQFAVVEVSNEPGTVNRDDLVRILHAENVLARRYFYPGCHRMEPYRSFYPHARLLLPQTERLVQRVLALPTGPAVSGPEIDNVSSLLEFVIADGPAIRRRMESMRA